MIWQGDRFVVSIGATLSMLSKSNVKQKDYQSAQMVTYHEPLFHLKVHFKCRYQPISKIL